MRWANSSKESATFKAPTHVSLLNSRTYIPKDREITYGKIFCDYKPHKKEKERVRLTVGGDRLDYSGDVATSTADITTFKKNNQQQTINERRLNDDDGD
jgi:hypothetical protein